MAKLLSRRGYTPIVVDNLSGGRPNKIIGGQFVEGDIADSALIERLIKEHGIRSILHFAAFIKVDESVREPEKYFANNTDKTLRLLDTAAAAGAEHFIFSSTAAVFGQPEYQPIDEAHPARPINPYGESKYRVEQALPEYEKKYGMAFGSLRYFNAVGADPEGELGPLHEPRSHLISIALDVARGRRDSITIHGSDYDTKDGSCVRDYIHVQDLCEAHLLLMEYLRGGGRERFFNLGTGTGYSVLEVLEAARRVTGKPIVAHKGPRRAGDPASLVADNKKACQLLGWKPQRSDLTTIIEDAWRWEQTLSV